MRSDRLMVIGSSMLGTTWTTITFASSKGPGGLVDAIDLETYTTELYQHSALQWAYARRPEDGFAPQQVATRFKDPNNDDKRVFALWWFIFPNLTLNFYPWGLSVNQYMPVRGRPDRTQFHWFQYSLDE